MYFYNQNTFEDVEITREETQNIDQVAELLEQSGSSYEAGERIKNPSFKTPCAQPRSKKFKSPATEEALSIMKEIKERNKSAVKDQYTVFGEQVGMRIRDLPSSRARNMVKHLISTTLFEAEMGKYDNINSNPYTYSPSYSSPHISQSPFPSALVSGSIPSLYQPQKSAIYQPQQSAISPTSSKGCGDSDSVDGVLMDT